MIASINILNIAAWVIFGLVVGFIVHLIDPIDVQGGVLGTLFTGIIGALIGGFLSYTIFGVTISGFDAPSLIISVVGALVFTAVERALFRREMGGFTQLGMKGGKSKKKRN